MSSPKQEVERRTSERRENDDRRSDSMRAAAGDRRGPDQRGMVAAMSDALEDILKWERASERMKVAPEAKPSSIDVSAS